MLKVVHINKDQDVIKELSRQIFDRLKKKWDRDAEIKYMKHGLPKATKKIS